MEQKRASGNSSSNMLPRRGSELTFRAVMIQRVRAALTPDAQPASRNVKIHERRNAMKAKTKVKAAQITFQ